MSSSPTPRRSQTVPSVVPGRAVYQLTSLIERLDPGRMFPEPRPLEIELGSGDGGFLVAYAARHPERNFLGVERLLGRLRKLDKKIQRAGLSNALGIRIEARYFLRYLLPDACARALHVYFPDPWPKKRHHKRRLVNAAFVIQAARVLEPGGFVHLRTDSAPYFEQMLEAFAEEGRFERVEPPEELVSVPTDFEREFAAQGLPIHRVSYRKKPQPAVETDLTRR